MTSSLRLTTTLVTSPSSNCARASIYALMSITSTSNPFLISDATLMIALFGALASGSLAYARRFPQIEDGVNDPG